jgi:hypothetical protein
VRSAEDLRIPREILQGHIDRLLSSLDGFPETYADSKYVWIALSQSETAIPKLAYRVTRKNVAIHAVKGIDVDRSPSDNLLSY